MRRRITRRDFRGRKDGWRLFDVLYLDIQLFVVEAGPGDSLRDPIQSISNGLHQVSVKRCEYSGPGCSWLYGIKCIQTNFSAYINTLSLKNTF
jgi:hypothetical protein